MHYQGRVYDIERLVGEWELLDHSDLKIDRRVRPVAPGGFRAGAGDLPGAGVNATDADCSADAGLGCKRPRPRAAADGAIGKQPFATAQGDRIDLEPERIDQIMLHERLKEICTAVHVQIRPWLLLEGADLFRNVSAQKHGGLPFRRRHGSRGDVFGRCHDAWPLIRMARPIRRPNVKGFAP